jgi:hypothetical protein
MRHLEKTYRVHFTRAQERVCTLRRRLAAGLLPPGEAMTDLVAILYGEDYTASVIAALALGEHGTADAIVPLVETLLWSDDDHRFLSRQLRCAALHALDRIGRGDDLAENALFAARWDHDSEVAERARGLTPQLDLAS